jgi:altronate hydrolase
MKQHSFTSEPDQADDAPADRQEESFLLIHPEDNVQIVLDSDRYGVPVGHKIARRLIKKGEPVIKYGYPIGIATDDIQKGTWVHTHNLATALSEQWDPGKTTSIQKSDTHSKDHKPHVSACRFQGFVRADHRVGIRNEIWIIPTVGCVNKTAEKLAAYGEDQVRSGRWPGLDGVFAYPHPYGCSQLGDDHERTCRLLAALARHPNAGGVLIIGLGCEHNQVSTFQALLGSYDTERIAFLVAQDVSDEQKEGQTLLRQLAERASHDHRTPCTCSDLVIGLKCGGSDAFSGLTANPLLGRLTDQITSNGGRALLTEIPECFGAEHILLARAYDPAVRTALVNLISDFRHYYSSQGVPVYENPSPGNKAGGITTLEEKSLGCVQKGGQAPLMDVIRYSQTHQKSGLTLVEAPGNDLVSITALVAAGAQMVLFTTGRGNPLGAPVPTLKISSNTALAEKKPHWIDFDAGALRVGKETIDHAKKNLMKLVLETASGQYLTRSEQNGYREIAIFKNGVTL